MASGSPYNHTTRPRQPAGAVLLDGVAHEVWRPHHLTTDDYYAYQDSWLEIVELYGGSPGKRVRFPQGVMLRAVRAAAPSTKELDLESMPHLALEALFVEVLAMSRLPDPIEPAATPAKSRKRPTPTSSSESTSTGSASESSPAMESDSQRSAA